MKNMKKIVMPLAVGVLLTVGAQAQTKIAIEGQAYVITGTAASVNGTFRYEWYRNNVPISECTAATCTVPAAQCNGTNVVFKRKIVVTGGCAGDTEGFTNEVTVTFKCGGGHGTKIGSLCWADRNVGAAGAFTATAHEYGFLYQWDKNKAWPLNDGMLLGCPVYPPTTTWTVSPHPCPTGWRLPTNVEQAALNNTGSTWVNANAKGNTRAGRFFGPNHATCSFAAGGNMSNCIFLPAVGYHDNYEACEWQLSTIDNYGAYWSNTQHTTYQTQGYYLYFSSSAANSSGLEKTFALSLRCVQ